MFKMLLLQIHSLTLLEEQPGDAIQLLESLYVQDIQSLQLGSPVTVASSKKDSPDFKHDLSFLCSQMQNWNVYYQEFPILPLLDVLGTDKFMLLLSAVLTECRIIFVADDITTLSSCIFGCLSMLYPFSWPYLVVPVLSPSAAEQLSTPAPYLIGVQKPVLKRLDKDCLGKVLLVDLESGECFSLGGLAVSDCVGDSGSVLQKASEGLDRGYKLASQGVAQMSSLILGLAGPKGAVLQDGESSSRDLVGALLTDLRAVLAAKPGATNPLKGLFFGAASASVPKTQLPVPVMSWRGEGDRRVRETLLLFFVYLFHDASDFVNSKSQFDLSSFKQHRVFQGVGRTLLDFLVDFVSSKMFQKFLFSRKVADTDYFDCVSASVRQLPAATVDAVRSVLSARRPQRPAPLHPLTIRLCTAPNGSVDSEADCADGSPWQQSAESLCSEAQQSDRCIRITQALGAMLQSCVDSGGRGAAGSQGLRAMLLLRLLLLRGPAATLSAALDFLPLLLALRRLRDEQRPLAAAIDFISPGPLAELRKTSGVLLRLLLDHKRLVLLRRRAFQPPEQPSFTTCDLLVKGSYNSKTFPAFETLHQQLVPPNRPISHNGPLLLRRQAGRLEEDEEDEEEEPPTSLSTPAPKPDDQDAAPDPFFVATVSATPVPPEFRLVNRDTAQVLDIRYHLNQVPVPDPVPDYLNQVTASTDSRRKSIKSTDPFSFDAAAFFDCIDSVISPARASPSISRKAGPSAFEASSGKTVQPAFEASVPLSRGRAPSETFYATQPAAGVRNDLVSFGDPFASSSLTDKRASHSAAAVLFPTASAASTQLNAHPRSVRDPFDELHTGTRSPQPPTRDPFEGLGSFQRPR